ncbi:MULTISPECIES: hypothetical protein [Streptomyces]|uniref:Transcriptional regulator n=1 Tax=Streptomyces ramulosus TaxID=47762 RepID=A0ABW1FCJ2_9ACTN
MTLPRHPNRMLAALLTEADWSATDLARAVNALGAVQGLRLRYDHVSVARWLDGVRPRPPVAHLIGQVLGQRLGRRVTLQGTGLAEPPSGAAPVLRAALRGGDPVRRLAALCHADADPVRRGALASAALANPPRLHTGWGGRRPELPPADPRAPRVPAAAPGRLEKAALRTAVLGERYGGAHGRPALAAFLAAEAVPLLTAPAHPTVRRALFTGAAQLTLLLAGRTDEVGRPALARHYYDVALALARTAGDLASYTVVLRCLSVQAHRLGDHQQAAALADMAVDLAGGGVPEAVRAYLHAGRAAAGAGAGRGRGAGADLLTAETRLARATGPEGPFTSYPETALRYQRAEVLSCLGDHRAALGELELSLTRRPADHHKARTLLHARIADTLLALDEVDGAADHALKALRQHRRLAPGSAHGTLPRLAHRLAPYQANGQVRTFREALRSTAG